MISITPAAVAQIKKLANKENLKDFYFRIGIKAGGCNGFSQFFEFCQEVPISDLAWEVDEIKFISDPKSLKLLNGLQLDYISTLTKKAFILQNPLLKLKTCSCGVSFSL